MGMSAILFSGTEQFKKKYQYPFARRPSENCSNYFREEDI